ncbi:MAG: proton-conducting transporter membrane subunit [Rickettsiaceae bacterium]|nr:proton-conducting transporter membrane subunit [Rickettsiaceae bacterium]
MYSFLLHHAPALLIGLPVFFSLMIVITCSEILGSRLMITANILMLLYSLFILIFSKDDIDYIFGGYEKKVGIEFMLGHFESLLLTLQYTLASIFSMSYASTFKSQVEPILKEDRRFIPYALFLIVNAGFSGIILTNDAFNLYVFLEIVTISSYPLLAISNEKKAINYTFDYLIIGTVASSLILVFVGFLLILTGSLNLSIIKEANLAQNEHLQLILPLLFVGILIKLAIFPFHSWKIQSYSSTSATNSIFFLSLGNIIIIALFHKFHFLYSSSSTIHQVYLILCISALVCSILGYFTEKFIDLLIYSSISSFSSFLLLWPYGAKFGYGTNLSVALELLIIDSVTKMGLAHLTLIAKTNNLNIRDVKYIFSNHRYLNYSLIFLLLNAASLPPTIMFYAKIELIEKIFKMHSIYLPFILVSSCFTILTFMNILKIIITAEPTSKNDQNVTEHIKSYAGMLVPTAILLLLLIFSNILYKEFLV